MEALRIAAVRAILKCCSRDLELLLTCNAAPEDHLGLPLSVISLADCEPELAEALYARPMDVLALLDEATIHAQATLMAASSGLANEALPSPPCIAPTPKELKTKLERQLATGVAAATGPNPDVQLTVVDNVHVRLWGLPSCLDPRPSVLRPPLSRIGCAQLRQLISVVGTVVRSGPVRMWESNHVYECTRCKGRFGLKSSLEGGGVVDVPEACPIQRTPPCSGSKFTKVPGLSIYSGFQEIRLQAATACLGLGEPPASLTVVLQDELSDSVKPGDSVEVVGVLVPRWISTTPGQRCELELVLVANNLMRRAAGSGRDTRPAHPTADMALVGGGAQSGANPVAGQLPGDLSSLFEDFWHEHARQPLLGRNKILAGVCPGIAGLLSVKLAVLLVLIGGVARRDEGGTHIRGEVHLLLVGDPGTGKSQLMKWASQASPGRAVLTTGRGSSGAGLTVAAVRDRNSWALEAGALVLADGGLCCIDEFDGIRPAERAVIHEAMEQQTVHVAKAGLVTNLSTRTSIIGAVNPRPGTALSCNRPLTEVTGLEGPLLSRFDLVLLLADLRHPDWDSMVAGHVLARRGHSAGCADTPSAEGAGQREAGRLPDLKAALPCVLAYGEHRTQQRSAQAGGREEGSGRGGGAVDESRLSIAQRVAMRLAGVTPATAAREGGNGGDRGTCQQDWAMEDRQATTGDSGQPQSSTTSGWTLEVIRKYVTWVRGRHSPVMTPEAERVLVSYYGAMRAAAERTAARSTIRALESLIRSSQAHARLLASDRVELRDAVVAVTLADTSLQLLHVPGGDSVTCARFPDDPDAELRCNQRIVLTALGLSDLLPQPLPAPDA